MTTTTKLNILQLLFFYLVFDVTHRSIRVCVRVRSIISFILDGFSQYFLFTNYGFHDFRSLLNVQKRFKMSVCIVDATTTTKMTKGMWFFCLYFSCNCSSKSMHFHIHKSNRNNCVHESIHSIVNISNKVRIENPICQVCR